MIKIDQENRTTILVVVIALFAVALVASTITSVAAPAGGDDRIHVDPIGAVDERGGNNNDTSGGVDGGPIESSDGGFQLTYCIDFLTTPVAITGIIAGVFFVLYLVYRQFNLATSLFSSFVIAPLAFGMWAIMTNCVEGKEGGGQVFDGSGIVNPGESGSVVTAPPISPTMLAMVFVFLVAVSLVVMLTVTGSDETYEPVEDEEPDEPDEAAFARAAGRAADRIEQGNDPVDNAVYRAWAEMTNLLDIPDPETSAPMDFADAAIEFGLEADDVHELAELFNEVRYGHKSAEEREDRAIEILRRVETTYQQTVNEPADSEGDEL